MGHLPNTTVCYEINWTQIGTITNRGQPKLCLLLFLALNMDFLFNLLFIIQTFSKSQRVKSLNPIQSI